MYAPRYARIFWWYIREILRKYRYSAAVGITVGFFAGYFGFQVLPTARSILSPKSDRIGVVGTYTGESLPLHITSLISVGLTGLSEDRSAVEGLAYAWEATDSGKTYSFLLDTGRTWHDGNPVLAADVSYNIRDVRFSATDPYTVKVELPTAYSALPIVLSKPLFKPGFIGLGDYRVVDSRNSGNTITSLTLMATINSDKRFRQYQFYRTEEMAVMAYKLGDIDTIHELSHPHDLADWKQTLVESKPAYDRIISVFFNMKAPEVSSRQFRQALGYAMPHLEGERAYSPISQESWAYNDKVKQYSYDEKQARKLLTDSKVDVQSTTLTLVTFPGLYTVGQMIVDAWKSFGINVNLKVENSIPEDYQIALTMLTVPPDPDQYLLWHSTQTDTNISGYANAKVDKLLEDGRAELDPTSRKQIYAEFQKFIVEDAPALFLYYPTVYSVKRQ